MSDVNELLTRAQNLQSRLENLRISGPGWSGNTRSGFMFNPRPRGVTPTAAPPPPTCASTSISISFSGIQFDCGCVAPTNNVPGETESINIINASALNSTFTLSNNVTVGASCIFDITIPVIINANWDRGSLGCVTDLTITESDISVLINNGDFSPTYPLGANIFISIGGDFGFGSSLWVFIGRVSPGGSLVGVPNLLSCNVIFADPAGFNSGGHGGTCTITGI